MNHSHKLALKPGYSIYFGMVWFKSKIATIGAGLGLTDRVYPFVVAANAASAEELLRVRYKDQDIYPEIRRISVKLGLNQNIHTYVEPEKITGFNTGVLR